MRLLEIPDHCGERKQAYKPGSSPFPQDRKLHAPLYKTTTTAKTNDRCGERKQAYNMKHGSILPPPHQEFHALPHKTATPGKGNTSLLGARRLVGMDVPELFGLLPFLFLFLFAFLSLRRAPVRAVKAFSFFLVDRTKTIFHSAMHPKAFRCYRCVLKLSRSIPGAPVHARRVRLTPRDELTRSQS